MTRAPSITLAGGATIDGAPLFADLRLTLPAGQWSCLLGPSGVGKTTVLRLFLGLETGAEFTGDITADDGAAVAPRASYMAQSDLLLPWLSLRKNVMIGAKLRGEPADLKRAEQMLDRVGLAGHADKRPSELSGGMRQRAALARTLLENRPIVFLDEPFSALDAQTRADMQELAAEVLANKTVLLVTHDPAEAARLGHQIMVLSTAGLRDWPVPNIDPIRPIQAPETQSCHLALLAHLRGETS